jgi:hypothetical protein
MNRTLEMHDMNEAIYMPCREKIETTTRTDRDNRLPEEHANRRVRFQPALCTTFVRSDVTFQTLAECKHLVWYQPADIQKFQCNDEILVKKYRAFVRNNQRLGQTKSKYIEKLGMETEMRGLEDEFNLLAQMRHLRRLEDSCRAVLMEQERQWDLWSKDENTKQSFILDAEMIRKVYSNSSMNSKLIAYSLGRSDATFARQFQNDSPICEYVSRNHNSTVVNKNRKTKSTLQRDRDQMPFKSKEEKKSTNVTASSILRQLQLSHIHTIHTAGTTRVSI